jgi:hypothetical protein
MKIIEETSTRLVIKHQPIKEWLIGGCFFSVSLMILITTLFNEPISVRLTCTRSVSTQTNCELQQFYSLGSKKTLKIVNPQEAVISASSSSKGGTTYQIVIVAQLGEFELVSHNSYEENLATASQINKFISSEQSLLLIQQNQRNYLVFTTLFMLIFVISGAFMATTPITNCVFYKSLNQVVIERKGLHTNKIIEYPLDKIHRVHVDMQSSKGQKIYGAVIIFKSLEQVPINREYVANGNNIFYLVDRINNFIGADQ